MNQLTWPLAAFDEAVAHTPPFSSSSAAHPSHAPDDPDHPIRTFYCSHCGYPLRIKMSCGDRTCPTCRRKWYGYHYGALKQYIASWPKVYFLTLTLKNIPDKQISKWHLQRLREAFSKLRYRLRHRIKDGYYVIQMTNSGTGWHLHLHALFCGEYVPVTQIAESWHQITKDSYIVNIKLVEKWEYALRYLLSDFQGKPRIREQDHEAYNSLLHGSRLVQGFGRYSKIKLRVPFRCPVCGDCSWTILESLLSDRMRVWPASREDDSS
jgi:hypothetical protein